ncbi:MAG: DUF4416 family protein [Phycisphaerae bacterium]|nr:DUF4416 family protein [Phycisphaerae bacterium]
MGTVKPPPRAKLLCGLLASDLDLMKEAIRRLRAHFGPIDLESETWPFDQTDYYEFEMGTGIGRRFVFFEELVSVERLAEIKRLTNDLETSICDDVLQPHDRRPVNIDPGYMTLSKFVLATTKDYSHRIYVGRGIHAEVTLHYADGVWQPYPWTYPDYAAHTYHEFFESAREKLKQQLRANPPH